MPARVARAVRGEIRLQQSELHQIELGAAAADAFELARYRFECRDRRGEIAQLESRKAARHRWNHRS